MVREDMAEVDVTEEDTKIGPNGDRIYADLSTLKSLKPELLFMLCEWNTREGPSEARSPMKGGSGGPPPEIKKNYRVILELYL